MLDLFSFFLFVAQIAQPNPAVPIAHRCALPAYGDHTITVAGSSETYNIIGPPGMPGPAPLLVLFHHYNGNHASYTSFHWEDYDLRDRAIARGWYVVMHDGGDACSVPGNHNTYGNDSFQDHTEAVIADVLCRFPIDRNQIYGYGFSMGGQVLSYAARHRDPSSKYGFFAAVVNHSGYFPIYQRFSVGQPQGCSTIPTCTYGTTYCNGPYTWRRADILDLTPINCAPTESWGGNPWPPEVAEVRYWTSQIHNLARTPIRTYRTVHEVGDCMASGNDLWQDFLTNYYGASPGIDEYIFDCGTDLNCPTTCNQPDCTPIDHQWDAVCADRALDRLATYTRDGVMAAVSSASNITLIAEDEVRYYHFTVDRTNDDDFGRVIWYKPNPNAMGFLLPNPFFGPSAVHNLNRLTIFADTPWSPLDVTNAADPLEIHTKYVVINQIRGYATAPSAVTKNGAPQTQGIDWAYDAVNKLVQFTSGAGTEVWRFVP